MSPGAHLVDEALQISLADVIDFGEFFIHRRELNVYETESEKVIIPKLTLTKRDVILYPDPRVPTWKDLTSLSFENRTRSEEITFCTEWHL